MTIMAQQTARIATMGQLGEGVTKVAGQPVFVPFALPGEEVSLLIEGERARLQQVLTPSAERRQPFCRHFGRCGGCALQHWEEEAYRAWKRQLLVTALSYAGLDPAVAPIIDAHGEGRRRVTLHVRFQGGKGVQGKVLAGFMMARSHEVIDLDQCPILVPMLDPAPEIARQLGTLLGSIRKPLDVQLTATEAGIDADLRGSGRIEPAMRIALGDAAIRLNLARLTLHGEIIVEQRSPVIRFGSARVTPPAGGFLQATLLGEEILSRLVLDGVGGAKSIADLFSGVGPFALRLAAQASVLAADSSEPSIAALKRGHSSVQGLKPVRADARDLFRRPLLSSELKGVDAVVLDPPRAGAQAQMRELAGSTIATIVSVSCNPASFARDAAILVAGGYRLCMVTPVDQFKFSAHLECVGVFRRV